MNIDMLVFGEDWGQHPSSTQHLMKHLLKEQQIVWVNSLGLRRPRLNRRDLHRAFNKLSACVHGTTTTQNSMREHTVSPENQPRIINPLTIPLPGNRLARRCNEWMLTQKLNPIIRSSDSKPLLWTSLPSAVDLVGKLGERAAVYYCGDDFNALDGVDHEPVSRMEQELAEKCQLIITASDQLARKFNPDKTVVVPHGVDLELFSAPKPKASDLPEGPVAGFYGAIAGWFDQRLLVETARRLPDWTFVLIGPVTTDISQLSSEPNIRYLGPKPHHELAGYSQHWDVGILPFKRNAQIKACNPLKLREYLAAGSPIVCTDFPALDGYRDLIKVSNQAESFAQAILSYHQNTDLDPILRAARLQRVALESWSKRAEDIKDLLLTL